MLQIAWVISRGIRLESMSLSWIYLGKIGPLRLQYLIFRHIKTKCQMTWIWNCSQREKALRIRKSITMKSLLNPIKPPFNNHCITMKCPIPIEITIQSGWCFGTCFIFPSIGNVIIPIWLSYFSEGFSQPPTSHWIYEVTRKSMRRWISSFPWSTASWPLPWPLWAALASWQPGDGWRQGVGVVLQWGCPHSWMVYNGKSHEKW